MPENAAGIGERTEIGERAFSGCSSLKDITIPGGVTEIDHYAFYDCSNLTRITIPNSVTSIGQSAFKGCTNNLSDVYISDIGAWCKIRFADNESSPLHYATNLYVNGVLVTDIVIPDGVTCIGKTALSCDNLESVTIPDSVTMIDAYAFWCCRNLNSVTMGNGVKSISTYAFAGCNKLASIHISDLAAWCKIDFGL